MRVNGCAKGAGYWTLPSRFATRGAMPLRGIAPYDRRRTFPLQASPAWHRQTPLQTVLKSRIPH